MPMMGKVSKGKTALICQIGGENCCCCLAALVMLVAQGTMSINQAPWVIGPKRGLDVEVSQVQWFCPCTDMEHWQEEVKILGQEFCNTHHRFHHMADVWGHLTEDMKDTPGSVTYVKQKLAMFQQMAVESQGAFEKVAISNHNIHYTHMPRLLRELEKTTIFNQDDTPFNKVKLGYALKAMFFPPTRAGTL
ncbi:hypothetical protein B0H10DRAFT_1951431 [Mycena sp. CBHHK59/15]|nr:hypothetical protein B0H10DRAFT_1951431 [Mycena sp. CBHHK59/15]